MPDRTLLLNTHCLPVISAAFRKCPPPFICSLFKKFSSGGTSSCPSLWFAKTTSDPFWKGGLCGLSEASRPLQRLPGSCQDSCEFPTAVLSLICMFRVPGMCGRAKWLELIQSSWSFSSPFTSLWLGPPLTLLYCESHGTLETEPEGPPEKSPKCGDTMLVPSQHAFPFQLLSFPNSSYS